MKTRLCALLLLSAFILSSCSSVPITGRKRLMVVSDSEILTSSLSEYQTYMKSATRSTQKGASEMVTRAGSKIAAATEQYLRDNGMEDEINNFAWEFSLVQDPQVNAFCMPGGKIVVYEGLMGLIDREDELAVVLGHEVAHAVAKHSNERMSQQVMASAGSAVLSIVLRNKSSLMQGLAQEVYGLGAQVGVMLPYSRKHEYEADYIGMVLMSLAGYEPEYAVTFWKKMSASSSGSRSELLSTHPSDENRIKNLEEKMEEVKKNYQKTSSK